MTISRSRGAHLAAVALALGLCAAPLLPLASQQPQAQPTPPAAAAQQPAAAGQPALALPPVHTVQQGETLWGLAKQFLGDPLLWPEIYRLNTMVIEDPHWIFPGEELRFAPPPPDTTQAAPAAPAAPAEVTVAPALADTTPARPQPSPSGNPFDAPTIFAAKGGAAAASATLQLQSQQAYRPVRAGEHFAAGWLTEGELLPDGKVLGNTRTASISRLSAVTSATIFSEVAVVPPPGDSLKNGDLLLSYEVPRRIDPWGELILPTGLLKVTDVGEAGANAMAQVIGVYRAILSDQKVIAVPAFQRSNARSVAVDTGGIVGSVIDVRDQHELITMQDVLFIDKGAEDSVRLGDLFQISGTTTAASGIGTVVQNEAKVLIVYVRPHTSSGVVVQIDRPDIKPGATARQIRRMPS
jgi:LysM repeat protein